MTTTISALTIPARIDREPAPPETAADGQVRLEINDRSPSATPGPQVAAPDAEGGRGLWLVDVLVAELSGTWGFSADGTVAWCVLPVIGP
ncbi:hypothetical protein ACFZAV_38515 [Streptomyces sp. NPDC008343]|uniref:hypothetical protein n=1 Tax=Streptomyces sp. NPDC008343 TaxID=3364828 RepID=UPI0036E3972A